MNQSQLVLCNQVGLHHAQCRAQCQIWQGADLQHGAWLGLATGGGLRSLNRHLLQVMGRLGQLGQGRGMGQRLELGAAHAT